MPMIGFGTGSDATPANLTSIIVKGIEFGHRHFDSASSYNNEEFVGQAIAQALERGLIDNRSDVFVTSKLWCLDADHDLVLPALKETLRKLGLDYVDLYLIHFPVRLKKASGMHFPKGDIFPTFDIRGTWEAMEECYRLGLAKSIGVSNYSCKKLSQLLTYSTITPAVNQVEMNPGWQQGKLRKFCNEKGIQVLKSIAQVSLRWIHQQGAIPIFRSFNDERMKENLQIFDWELTQEELDKISQIPQKRGFSGDLLRQTDLISQWRNFGMRKSSPCLDRFRCNSRAKGTQRRVQLEGIIIEEDTLRLATWLKGDEL